MKKGTRPARNRNKSARYRAKKKLRIRRKRRQFPGRKKQPNGRWR
jgi:hypothetical protein